MRKNIVFLTAGIFIGLVNGFLGGGGGVICFPVLCALYKLNAKSAHATTLLVILPISIISAGIYLFNGHVDWALTIIATLGICLGGAVGAKLLNKLDNFAISLIYGVILFLSALQMLFSS